MTIMRLASVVISLAAFVTPAQAELLRYSLSGTASGSLNGVSFAPTPVTISGLADSSSIVIQNYEFYLPGSSSGLPREGGSVTLGGVTIAAPAAFGTLNWSPITVAYGELHTTYYLTFGPFMRTWSTPFVSGYSVRLAEEQNRAFQVLAGGTDDGPFNQTLTLTWRGVGFADPVVRLQVAAVPEPSAFALVALGLLGLGAALRRRR